MPRGAAVGCSEPRWYPQPLPERSLWDAQGLSLSSCTSPSMATNQTRCGELLCPPRAPNPGRICGGACSSPLPSSTCSSGKWPSAAVRVPEPCLPHLHALPALRGRSASWHGAAGVSVLLFPSSPALPGGLPSALGSARHYGRAQKGRARTAPECRENFLEFPRRKEPSALCAWRCEGGWQLPAPLVDPPGKGWSWDPPALPLQGLNLPSWGF